MELDKKINIKKISKRIKEPVYGNGLSLVEEEKGKCLIIFLVWPYARDGFDEDLGLIAILIWKGINFTKVYRRSSEYVYEGDENPEEIVYEFDKKYTKKIKEIEKAYFTGKIQIEAHKMSQLLIYVVNYNT